MKNRLGNKPSLFMFFMCLHENYIYFIDTIRS